MSNAVAHQTASGLAALQSLRSGLAQVRTQIPASVGGQPLLRLLKDGQWVMGQEDSAVAAGTEVVANPLSIQSGYSCWTNRAAGQGKNELMGEEMWGIGAVKPMAFDMPKHTDPRTGAACDWKDCLSVDLKIIMGPYEGQQVLFKTTSVGGVRVVTALIDAIMEKLDSGSRFICPIVSIGSDSYNHKSYGRTYVPTMEIVGWASMEGDEEPEAGEPAPVDQPVTQQRVEPARQETKRQPDPSDIGGDPAPAATTAPAGRRRRV